MRHQWDQRTIKDQLANTTSRVRDVQQVRACLSRESLGAGVAGSGDEQDVVVGTSGTDGIDGSLDGSLPV